jgi:hypothetical protein
MGIFRAVFRSQEKSERVLALTKDILAENAASYTVWYAKSYFASSLLIEF